MSDQGLDNSFSSCFPLFPEPHQVSQGTVNSTLPPVLDDVIPVSLGSRDNLGKIIPGTKICEFSFTLSSIGTGFPEKRWSPHPWKCPKGLWMRTRFNGVDSWMNLEHFSNLCNSMIWVVSQVPAPWFQK